MPGVEAKEHLGLCVCVSMIGKGVVELERTLRMSRTGFLVIFALDW